MAAAAAAAHNKWLRAATNSIVIRLDLISRVIRFEPAAKVAHSGFGHTRARWLGMSQGSGRTVARCVHQRRVLRTRLSRARERLALVRANQDSQSVSQSDLGWLTAAYTPITHNALALVGYRARTGACRNLFSLRAFSVSFSRSLACLLACNRSSTFSDLISNSVQMPNKREAVQRELLIWSNLNSLLHVHAAAVGAVAAAAATDAVAVHECVLIRVADIAARFDSITRTSISMCVCVRVYESIS